MAIADDPTTTSAMPLGPSHLKATLAVGVVLLIVGAIAMMAARRPGTSPAGSTATAATAPLPTMATPAPAAVSSPIPPQEPERTAAAVVSSSPRDLPSQVPGAESSADPAVPDDQPTSPAAQAFATEPQRFASLQTPTAFDVAQYQADPSAYCAQVVPSRIWQVAQPGRDVRPLGVLGESMLTTTPGNSLTLVVQAVPDAPVTLLSADLGGFANGHTAITVRADADGVATATWTATPGTTGACHILAASPLTSGQVELYITVEE